MRVALFATCLADQFFAEACADAVRLLRHVGAEVDFPERQTCCGQPALNSGHAHEARRLAAHTLDVFDGYDYIVLPSGSCAGMVRTHYPGLLEDRRDLKEARPGPGRERHVRDLTGRTFELAQFLADVCGVHELGRGLAGRRIAYHHGCHALRELGVRDQPVRLLEGGGAEVVGWEADEECCGFGGLFSGKLPEVSAGMADRKLDTVPPADVVTSADGGCLLQLSGRASHRGEGVPFVHLATLLWEAVSG